MKCDELLKKLKKVGWRQIRQNGSHKILRNEHSPETIVYHITEAKKFQLEQQKEFFNKQDKMSKYKLIVEKNKDGFWSQVEQLPGVFSSGDSISNLIDNSKEAIELYFEETGKHGKRIEFELVMDIQEFFKINEFINISSLAKRIGMNSSLLRQYSKGIKFPSLEQVARIEKAIKQIGKELSRTELQPV